MKINVSGTILDYDNTPKKDGEGKEMTWRSVILFALNATTPDEVITAEDKIKFFNMSLRTQELDEVDFSVDELAIIKKRVTKIYTSPLIAGRASLYFEGKTEEPKGAN